MRGLKLHRYSASQSESKSRETAIDRIVVGSKSRSRNTRKRFEKKLELAKLSDSSENAKLASRSQYSLAPGKPMSRVVEGICSRSCFANGFATSRKRRKERMLTSFLTANVFKLCPQSESLHGHIAYPMKILGLFPPF